MDPSGPFGAALRGWLLLAVCWAAAAVAAAGEELAGLGLGRGAAVGPPGGCEQRAGLAPLRCRQRRAGIWGSGAAERLWGWCGPYGRRGDLGVRVLKSSAFVSWWKLPKLWTRSVLGVLQDRGKGMRTTPLFFLSKAAFDRGGEYL